MDFFKNLQNFVEIFGENPENFGGNFENPEKSPRPAPSAPWNGFGFGSGMDLGLVFPQELSGTTIWIWKKESDPVSTLVPQHPLEKKTDTFVSSLKPQLL